MSGLKSGATVLLLSIPFILYAAWQVQGVARPDMILSEGPSDKGLPPKEQIAAARGKAEKWAGDVQKTTTVALQFRPFDKATEKSADKECNDVAEAAAKRAADLDDLRKFLTGGETHEYTGSLKNQYLKWEESKKQLAKAEKAVTEWFTAPIPEMESREAAAKVMAGFIPLVDEYSKDTRFSDLGKATGWRVRARLRVIEALHKAADAPYKRVLELPLPFPDNADVRKVVNAPKAIGEQVSALQAELENAKGRSLPPGLAEAAAEKVKQAEEWAAREQLLDLFAKQSLFTDPNGAADWLAQVQTQFAKSGAEGRALIHLKVQQFCDAYLPRAVVLDDTVILNGKRVPREKVQVEYSTGAGRERKSLTNTLAGLNEFNVAERYPEQSTRLIHDGGEYKVTAVAPTELSRAAVVFTDARTKLESGTGAPKWSAKSVEELKNKCKALAPEVNRLKVLGGKSDAPQIWDRVVSLAKGAEECKSLFEKGQ